MTEIPDVRAPGKERREMTQAAKKEAYANLLERTERALEIQYNGEWYYIVAVDGKLYHAQNNGEPQETGVQWLELLFTGDRVDLIAQEQCHEFEEIL